jgi:GT2 family glycosyltransferase
MKHIAVVTVTYGSRWNFLSQVADAVLGDPHVCRFIVVDNGSSQKEELRELSERDERVTLITLERNLGSAGGFSCGLEAVRKESAAYVLLLDDDIVPQNGFVEAYMKNYNMIADDKAVMCGNRADIPGNEEYLMRDPHSVPVIRGTFFEIFSWEKVRRFINIARYGKVATLKEKHAWVPSEGFAYGGSFLPMEAVRTAPLPDKDLVLYFDDIEYSWGVLRAGFRSYLCATPLLHDIDMSFGQESQTLGLCNPAAAPFKAYYFLRNRVRVSVRNTTQSKTVLFLNILIWMAGFCVLGLVRYGFSRLVLKRVGLLIQAVRDGYALSSTPPQGVVLP